MVIQGRRVPFPRPVGKPLPFLEMRDLLATRK
jgi:hypothetical protein